MSNDKEAQEFFDHAAKTLKPMVENSELFVTLYTGKHDAKIAIELGYALLLNKPIYVLCQKGAKVPEALGKLAVDTCEYDPADAEGTHAKVQGMLTDAVLKAKEKRGE